MSVPRRVGVVLAGSLLLAAPGCSPTDPGAGVVDKPIVTSNAPRTSQEAGAREQAEREQKAAAKKSSSRRP